MAYRYLQSEAHEVPTTRCRGIKLPLIGAVVSRHMDQSQRATGLDVVWARGTVWRGPEPLARMTYGSLIKHVTVTLMYGIFTAFRTTWFGAAMVARVAARAFRRP